MSFFVVSAVLVFVLDQVTKSMVQNGLENRPVRFGRIVTLRFLSSSKRYYQAAPLRAAMSVVWLLAAGAALLLAVITDRSGSPWMPIAMGSAVGGAAGNLIDVLRTRAVRDFIDFGWWPVFNLADVAIVAGVAGMLIGQ